MKLPLASTLALALALAACTDADPQQSPPEAADAADASTAPAMPSATVAAAPPAVPAPTASATIGGDGSAISLSALSGAEIEAAALSGELGCSFSTADAAPLLVAKGNVASSDPAFGIVKIGDYVERVAAPGGFDAMAKGTTFSGRGTTIRIAPTGNATDGGESPPRPATLTFDRADGARRVFDGRWECGP